MTVNTVVKNIATGDHKTKDYKDYKVYYKKTIKDYEAFTTFEIESLHYLYFMPYFYGPT